MKLRPDEIRLQGSWTFENNEIKKDNIALRIDYLKDDYLIRVGTDDSGWDILYQDPSDNRYWELVYTDSEIQGGGAPLLQNLSIDSVRKKYHIQDT